jgi:hypothetical protein
LKHQHWRASPAVFDLEGAPMLVFVDSFFSFAQSTHRFNSHPFGWVLLRQSSLHFLHIKKEIAATFDKSPKK